MTALATRPTETEADQPRYLITDAGMEALRAAVVVPDDDDDLDAFVDTDAEELVLTGGEDDQARPAFVPDTKEKADWVLDKIATRRARAARVREHAEQIARAAEREAEALEWKYGAALQDLARRETEGKRRKSVPLYHGVIGFKTSPQRVRVTAGMEGQAVAWARLHKPEAITERVDAAALKGAVSVTEAGQAVDADTGEVLEWVSVTQPEEVFYIR